jgi:mono/diheme cytochrome c family protein
MGRLMGVMLTAANLVAIARAADEARSLDAESAEVGRVIYRQYCASCHGANAQGASDWTERDKHGELPAPPHNAEGHTMEALGRHVVPNGQQGLARSIQQDQAPKHARLR